MAKLGEETSPDVIGHGMVSSTVMAEMSVHALSEGGCAHVHS